jgi:hypothetical protein
VSLMQELESLKAKGDCGSSLAENCSGTCSGLDSSRVL